MSAHVCVVGSINTDLVIRTAHLPAPGETVLGGTFESTPGGKGANQAVAAARVGADVELVGLVGSDAHGETLLSILRCEDVGVEHVGVERDCASGLACITVADAGGENMIVVAPGANRRLVRAHIERARPAIRHADILLMQLEVPLDAVVHAAEIASAFDVPVVLNAAPARSLPPELLRHVDVLVVNRVEAILLAESRGNGSIVQSPDRLAAALVRRSGAPELPASVIVTLGADGALVHDGTDIFAVPAPRVKAIDTVGAGDAFCGAFAVRRAEGADMRDAVSFACAAGALATMQRGAIAALPRRDDVE